MLPVCGSWFHCEKHTSFVKYVELGRASVMNTWRDACESQMTGIETDIERLLNQKQWQILHWVILVKKIIE
jgi:hypothetical protein